MNFGLKEEDLIYIKKQIHSFKEIKEAIIFGSRAMGNYKYSSDIDLCLKGDHITLNTLSGLQARLQDTGPLPYTFDIIHYQELKNENFKNHIDQYGKILTKN